MHRLTERGWLAEGLGKQGVGRVHTDLRWWCRGGCWCREPEESPFGGQTRLGQPLQSPPSARLLCSASPSGWSADVLSPQNRHSSHPSGWSADVPSPQNRHSSHPSGWSADVPSPQNRHSSHPSPDEPRLWQPWAVWGGPRAALGPDT